MKTCNGDLCGGKIRPISDFYKSAHRKDGHRTQCKQCDNATNKAYRHSVLGKATSKTWRDDAVRKEKKRLYQERYHQTDAGKRVQARSQKKRNRLHPDRRRARRAVGIALDNGKLTKPEQCSKRACTCKPEAHHHSYLKRYWLDVRWLCRKHHLELHADIRAAALKVAK